LPEYGFEAMGPFLISSALGFVGYQLAVWLFISEDRLFLKLGGSVINLTPEAAAWLRRVVGVLLVGLGLSLGLLFHKPFVAQESIFGGAVVLGFFYGPLLAVWINSLIAKDSNEEVSTGQYVAGIGLALLFLVGSVGNQAGDLIQGYARKVSKISIAGAEFTFDRKSSDVNPLGGSLPLSGAAPTYASSSGAIGLEYLSQLHAMIHRDIEYLKIFKETELRKDKSKQTFVDQKTDRQLFNDIETKKKNIDAVLDALDKAELFAKKTVKRPAACLVGWYSTTGDTSSVNKHLAALAEVFKRLPTIESGQPVEDLAAEFVEQSFLIGVDAVDSVPSLWLGDTCDDLLEEFCPAAFIFEKKNKLNDVGKKLDDETRKRDDSELRACLKQLQTTVKANNRPPIFAELQHDIEPDLTNFVQGRGWEARPYFALGYASILSQLGQNQAASAVLDGWINTRFTHPNPVWITAADWFDVRARAILANFLEDWIRKEGPLAPTALRNEHIANLESLRSDLRSHLLDVDFFQEIEATLAKPPPEELVDRLKEPMFCHSRDPDSDNWQRLFESYITGELTYLKALMSHPNYADQFSERATAVATRLAGMDLSCIPRVPDQSADLVHRRARTFYAQILDAFGDNAYQYSASRWTTETVSERQKRLSDALHAVEFGLNLINGVALNDRERKGSSFLRRIEPSDAVDAEEKLKLTEKKLKMMKDYQQ
jgi:hypothetical protein